MHLTKHLILCLHAQLSAEANKKMISYMMKRKRKKNTKPKKKQQQKTTDPNLTGNIFMQALYFINDCLVIKIPCN